MGSDRQSIMLHENGKKHREAVELDLKKRRDDKLAKEKHKKDLDSVFASVNAAVGISVGSAGGGAAGSSNFGVAKKPWEQYQTNVVAAQAQAVLSSSTSSQQAVLPTIIKKEPIKVTSSSSTATAAVARQKQKQPELFDPTIGHYEIEGITYLEGSIYANILEEGMPIQLWMGSTLATNDEKRDLRNYNHWKKMALVAKVVTKKKRRIVAEEDDYGESSKQEVSCHVSYLQNETDDDETIETNVPPSRIRLVLGSDPLIPGTLEEAHLALLGGEQIIQVKEEDDDKKKQQRQQQRQQQLQFGYMGSLPSLKHTDNFLHYKELSSKSSSSSSNQYYPISFVDTDKGELPTTLHYQMDMSIRPLNTEVSRFKTSAKIATAAALGHNIITTYDEAVKDVLPVDYPFLLQTNNDNDDTPISNDPTHCQQYPKCQGQHCLWYCGYQCQYHHPQQPFHR